MSFTEWIVLIIFFIDLQVWFIKICDLLSIIISSNNGSRK